MVDLLFGEETLRKTIEPEQWLQETLKFKTRGFYTRPNLEDNRIKFYCLTGFADIVDI